MERRQLIQVSRAAHENQDEELIQLCLFALWGDKNAEREVEETLEHREDSGV